MKEQSKVSIPFFKLRFEKLRINVFLSKHLLIRETATESVPLYTKI